MGSIYARFRRPDGTTDAQLHHDDPRSGTTPAVPDETESTEAELVCVSLGATVDGLVERLGVTRRSVLPVLDRRTDEGLVDRDGPLYVVS